MNINLNIVSTTPNCEYNGTKNSIINAMKKHSSLQKIKGMFFINSLTTLTYLNEEGVNPIHQAIIDDNKEFVELFLNQLSLFKKEVLAFNSWHHTVPLGYAKTAQMAKLLITHGAQVNINYRHLSAECPLYSALKEKRIPVLMVLLANGAKPDHLLETILPSHHEEKLPLLKVCNDLFKKSVLLHLSLQDPASVPAQSHLLKEVTHLIIDQLSELCLQ
jgi:ankyrin repeat protein